MNKGDTNKQLDDDILQCKEDILRAKDIIPFGNSKVRTNQKPTDIPKFDLAEQIMARHRKVTTAKRKSPGRTIEPEKSKQPAEPVRHVEQIKPPAFEDDQIIAEIVANDIKRLCQGSPLNLR